MKKPVKITRKSPKQVSGTESKVKVAFETRETEPVSISLSDIPPYRLKKGEEYMSRGMREHFKKILLAWRSDLRLAVDRTFTYMKETAANFSDLSDRATQEETFSLELRERDRERQLIKKIDEALRLLAEGSYGYCEICGEEIGLRRLEARPTANLCIDCKTLDEIREKQMGG